MGRKPINPEKKKKPISFTLTNEQRTLCEWTAAQLDISASEMIGKLIEKEAKRVSLQKKSHQQLSLRRARKPIIPHRFSIQISL